MIKRKAILIGCPGGYRELEKLKCIKKDLEVYAAFLKSGIGGQWRENEIVVLYDPSTGEALRELENAIADYACVIFCGHGKIESYTESDTIALRDEDISIARLVSRSHLQTIIIDAPRKTKMDDRSWFTLIDDRDFFIHHLKASTRKAFDEAISRTPAGIILVFAAEAGSYAWEQESIGGYFTFSLTAGATKWAVDNPGTVVLSLDKAIEQARLLMKINVHSDQNPEMAGQIRRLTFPPFAINAKNQEFSYDKN